MCCCTNVCGFKYILLKIIEDLFVVALSGCGAVERFLRGWTGMSTVVLDCARVILSRTRIMESCQDFKTPFDLGHSIEKD